MMTKERLAEIKARLDDTAARPWRHVETDVDYGNGAPQTRHRVYAADSTLDVCDDPYESDAVFIAHAPEDIAAMLAEIERLTAPVDVEAEAERVAREVVAPHLQPLWDDYEYKHWAKDAVRPLVTDRARLAREVERLTEAQAVKSHMAKTLAEDHRKARNALDEARAEIARLTAVKSAEIAPIIERFQAAFGADTPKAPSFTAAQGEAWERLREAAKVAIKALEGDVPIGSIDACYSLADALAAVEPRAEMSEIDAGLRAMVAAVTEPEDVDPIDTWVGGEPVPCAAPDITAITHDFRPGAQDGLPRLADVEAAPVHPDLARRLAGSIATRRAVPAMTAERAREVAAIEARHALAADPDVGIDAQDAHEDRGTLLAWVREPTPPRALTEAEARAWAARAYPQILHAGHRQNVIAALLLAASRGDVPPEVRPAMPLDLSALAATVPPDVMAAAREEARAEMAVTTGAPDGVPSIAGPAGLDIACKAGGGR